MEKILGRVWTCSLTTRVDTLFLPWCQAMKHLRLPRAGGEPPNMNETVMGPTLTLFLGNSK